MGLLLSYCQAIARAPLVANLILACLVGGLTALCISSGGFDLLLAAERREEEFLVQGAISVDHTYMLADAMQRTDVLPGASSKEAGDGTFVGMLEYNLTTNSSIFTPEVLQAMCKLENAFVRSSGYADVCYRGPGALLPWSYDDETGTACAPFVRSLAPQHESMMLLLVCVTCAAL